MPGIDRQEFRKASLNPSAGATNTKQLGNDSAAGQRPLTLLMMSPVVVAQQLLPMLAFTDVHALKATSSHFALLISSDRRQQVHFALVPLRLASVRLDRIESELEALRVASLNDQGGIETLQAERTALLGKVSELEGRLRSAFDSRLDRERPVPHVDALLCVRLAMTALNDSSVPFPADESLFDARLLTAWSADDVWTLYHILTDGGTREQLNGNLQQMESRLLNLAMSQIHGLPIPKPVTQNMRVEFVASLPSEAQDASATPAYPPYCVATVIEPDGRDGMSVSVDLPLWRREVNE